MQEISIGLNSEAYHDNIREVENGVWGARSIMVETGSLSHGQTDSQIDQVGASSRKQNLRMGLRWMTKRICNSPKLQKRCELHLYTIDSWSTCSRLALGNHTVKRIASTCVRISAWPNSMQVITSQVKPVKRNASRKIVSTCESAWAGLPKINN